MKGRSLKRCFLSATVFALCLAAASPAAAQTPCNAVADQYDPNPNNNCDSATTIVFDPGQRPDGAANASDDGYPFGTYQGGTFPFDGGIPAGVASATSDIPTETPPAETSPARITSTGISSTGAAPVESAPTPYSDAYSAPPTAASPATPTASGEAAASAAAPQPALPDTGGSTIFLLLAAGLLVATGLLMRTALRTR